MNARMAEWRIAALAHPCGYCTAVPAKPCVDPRTGYVLQSQAAHLIRLKAAGFGTFGQLYPDPPVEDDPRESDHDYYR